MPTKGKSKDESVGSVTLSMKTIRGKVYGVSAVSAALGGTDLGPGLVAVKAGRDKRVTTREHAVEWLEERGLARHEAVTFIAEGLGELLRSLPESPKCSICVGSIEVGTQLVVKGPESVAHLTCDEGAKTHATKGRK